MDDDRWPGRRAGLLLGWVRGADGWAGWVALAPDDAIAVVVTLVPAARLLPAAELDPDRRKES